MFVLAENIFNYNSFDDFHYPSGSYIEVYRTDNFEDVKNKLFEYTKQFAGDKNLFDYCYSSRDLLSTEQILLLKKYNISTRTLDLECDWSLGDFAHEFSEEDLNKFIKGFGQSFYTIVKLKD